MRQSLASGGLKKRADAYGQTLVGGSPDDFRAFLVKDGERWRRVLKNAGIKRD
jgi:tripartite-type tricarboxylate transporter receptor subunit TctC